MQTWLLLALARPSTASTADAADLDVPSIAKEVAELVLWDLDSDFPYSSLNPMGNPSLSAPEPNESVWYAEASPSPAVNRHCLKTRKVGTKTSLSNLVGSGKEVACAWRALSSEAYVRLN